MGETAEWLPDELLLVPESRRLLRSDRLAAESGDCFNTSDFPQLLAVSSCFTTLLSHDVGEFSVFIDNAPSSRPPTSVSTLMGEEVVFIFTSLTLSLSDLEFLELFLLLVGEPEDAALPTGESLHLMVGGGPPLFLFIWGEGLVFMVSGGEAKCCRSTTSPSLGSTLGCLLGPREFPSDLTGVDSDDFLLEGGDGHPAMVPTSGVNVVAMTFPPSCGEPRPI